MLDGCVEAYLLRHVLDLALNENCPRVLELQLGLQPTVGHFDLNVRLAGDLQLEYRISGGRPMHRRHRLVA
jgi:hypothetical protein